MIEIKIKKHLLLGDESNSLQASSSERGEVRAVGGDFAGDSLEGLLGQALHIIKQTINNVKVALL